MDVIVNITAMYWPLIEAIILLEYEELVQTRFYKIMHNCMVNEQTVIVEICGHQLVHKDLNDLFYNTRDFLINIGENEKANLIHRAILKMQGVVTEMELGLVNNLNNIFDSLSI
jgi:hypothetical protein